MCLKPSEGYCMWLSLTVKGYSEETTWGPNHNKLLVRLVLSNVTLKPAFKQKDARLTCILVPSKHDQADAFRLTVVPSKVACIMALINPFLATYDGRSQWPRGRRRRSPTAIVGRIPPGAWMFVCCMCLLSGRGLWDELITRPEESYQLWRVAVCDQETSWYEEVTARVGMHSQKIIIICGKFLH
jgi:hypothetical protein